MNTLVLHTYTQIFQPLRAKKLKFGINQSDEQKLIRLAKLDRINQPKLRNHLNIT